VYNFTHGITKLFDPNEFPGIGADTRVEIVYPDPARDVRHNAAYPCGNVILDHTPPNVAASVSGVRTAECIGNKQQVFMGKEQQAFQRLIWRLRTRAPLSPAAAGCRED
jgi:hypothetical protein